MLLPPPSAPQRRGLNNYANGGLVAGSNIVVAGGSNANGIIVRTAIMIGLLNSNTSIISGPAALFASFGANWVIYQGPGLLIRPGDALELTSTIAGGQAYLTYDIL